MSLSVAEFVELLADAFAWPRTRPARVALGDHAGRVSSVALCTSDAAIDSIDDRLALVLLASPAGAAFARAGRRRQDVFLGEQSVSEWARAERVVVDASELLSGGRGGFDELLLEALEIEAAAPVVCVPLDEVKFVGYVPPDAAEQVRGAIFGAGAGMIGAYSECSWQTEGTGTFRGGEGSSPTVGAAGQFEQVRELRIESVCRSHLRDRVARAFVAAHPYEEPAYDVYPLLTPGSVGLGRRAAEAPAAEELQARLADLTGGAELVAPVGAARAGSSLALTTGPLSPLLGAILAEEAISSVVVSSATAAERALLSERGVSILTIDRDAALRQLADRVAARLSDGSGVPVRPVASLQFPGAAG